MPMSLSQEMVKKIRDEFGTPVYIYYKSMLEEAARSILNFPNTFGLTVRFAMKALPTSAIIQIFDQLGLHIDASSGFEAERAMRVGVVPEKIQITAQQLPDNLKELVEKGVLFNATSLHQLETYGKLFRGAEVSVRINPGLGSGHNNRTNVGGPGSSFGIWHEYLNQVLNIQKKYSLRITRLHTHIGSGGDPKVWQRCARMSLDIAAKLPEVGCLNLGGGFKVDRMPDEIGADIQKIGHTLTADFENFTNVHGRELHLEIEPGTFLVANAGAIVANVIDVVDTGSKGYRFIKTDTGMAEILRPSIYGAQHPIILMLPDGESRPEHSYIITGRCCESGDILTPALGDPEALAPRRLSEAKIGDTIVVGGTGAYCAAMSVENYNSFPTAPEVLITGDGGFKLIRKRQTMDQIIANEIWTTAA